MSEDKTERLYEKLRKLTALKDSALNVGSVGEAEAAAAAIQRLLREYNLSEEEIPDGERIQNPMIMEDIPYYFVYRLTWFRDMVSVLARNNLCELLATEERKGTRSASRKLTIIGRETNVKMVKFLASQLANRFVAFCRADYKAHRQQKIQSGYTPCTEDVFARNFLMGCVYGLSAKLKEQDRPTESGLVLSRKAENSKFIEENFDNLGVLKPKASSIGNRQAFYSGYNKGKDVDIYEGIEKAKEEQKRLG